MNIHGVNDAPIADAGGPYSVGEGASIALNAAGTFDPTSRRRPLHTHGTSTATASTEKPERQPLRGNETGINPVFSAAGLDGPTSVIVGLRVTDDSGATSSDTAAISITNVPPQNVVIKGPDVGVPGQTLNYSATFSDPGLADTHSFNWRAFRQSNGNIVASGTGTAFNFVPKLLDSYYVQLSVSDDDNFGGFGEKTLLSVRSTVLVRDRAIRPEPPSTSAALTPATPSNFLSGSPR